MSWFVQQTLPNPSSFFTFPYQETPTEDNPISNNFNSKSHDTFKMSIHNLITFADMHSYSTFPMTFLCNQFGFQKRRLYDVINVFESVGMCRKTSVDTLLWIGRNAVASHIEKLKTKFQTINIGSLVSNEKCISISHLTSCLIVSFIINNTQIIDIKTVASLLSQSNNRYKTTLCKLYQIAHILEASNIISKTDKTGFIALSVHVFTPDPSKRINMLEISQSSEHMCKSPPISEKQTHSDIYNIQNLLNKPVSYSPPPQLLNA